MSNSLTCDRCGATSTRPRSWLTVSGSSMEIVVINGSRPAAKIHGDYCSVACLVAEATEYAAAVAEYSAKLPVAMRP